MKVEYFTIKTWYISTEIWSYFRTSRVKRSDGFVLCMQGQRKTSSSKFQAPWKRLRIVNKDRTFSNKYFLDFEVKFLDFEEKYGKYLTAGRLIISSLVTSLR